MNITDDIGPTSYSFVSQRLRLNYLDWGNSGAPTLILVHGGRDHARSWDRIARALRNDWHIIAPDLRGHGDSAWSPDGAYTMPYYICDLAQLIHQQGTEPVSIVAHSLGGAILAYTLSACVSWLRSRDSACRPTTSNNSRPVALPIAGGNGSTNVAPSVHVSLAAIRPSTTRLPVCFPKTGIYRKSRLGT
jgi:hypothetical protein